MMVIFNDLNLWEFKIGWKLKIYKHVVEIVSSCKFLLKLHQGLCNVDNGSYPDNNK